MDKRAFNAAFCEQRLRRGPPFGRIPCMTDKRKRPLRILANLYAPLKSARELTGGILRYAATHPGVEVRLFGLGTAWREIDEFRSWRPDGVIIGASGEAMVRSIESVGCRAGVFINVPRPRNTALRCGCVSCDDNAVAERAAGLFAGRRLRHFAYVGTRAGEAWSLARERAFGTATQGCGSFSAFSAPPSGAVGNSGDIAALAAWIAALPRPCGIFAANDMRAKDVLDACREAGVDIPRHAMVLGVDDEEFICGQVTPTLSSILPDYGRGGYLAAEMVAGLLARRGGDSETRYFGVKGVVERVSTSDPGEAGRMVLSAQEFIRAYATSPDISVGAVARASSASVRLLQKNFRAIAGTTVCEAIQEARLERARKLLAGTETPIGHIAGLCGFGDDAYLKKLFRRRHGCTMREWRRRGACG